MTGTTLIAGIGNIFLGDDGFGVAVAQRLAEVPLPDGVRVVDYGIRGMHLAHDLAGGVGTAILVDAAPRGEAPGTVYVIEPELGPAAAPGGGLEAAGDLELSAGPLLDAHGMQPDLVLGMLQVLEGERPDRILVVGCEPASTDYGMTLSEPVAAAVDEAVKVVLGLVGAPDPAPAAHAPPARARGARPAGPPRQAR